MTNPATLKADNPADESRAFQRREIAYTPGMKSTSSDFETSPLCAYAPDKQAWKEAGNRFTPEVLRAMIEHGSDIVIIDPPEPVYCAD